MFPSASTAIPAGRSEAPMAGPPSPVEAPFPSPATVLITPCPRQGTGAISSASSAATYTGRQRRDIARPLTWDFHFGFRGTVQYIPATILWILLVACSSRGASFAPAKRHFRPATKHRTRQAPSAAGSRMTAELPRELAASETRAITQPRRPAVPALGGALVRRGW